jgi:hypothetical protein
LELSVESVQVVLSQLIMSLHGGRMLGSLCQLELIFSPAQEISLVVRRQDDVFLEKAGAGPTCKPQFSSC